MMNNRKLSCVMSEMLGRPKTVLYLAIYILGNKLFPASVMLSDGH